MSTTDSVLIIIAVLLYRIAVQLQAIPRAPKLELAALIAGSISIAVSVLGWLS